MKQYPSIDYWNKGILGTYVYGFDKIDGSNLRSEYSFKNSKKNTYTNGFDKFGTRTQMTCAADENWGQGVRLFIEKYSEGLNKIFHDDKDFRNAKKITTFFEFYGPNSFAGWHDPEDKLNNRMDVVLFDVDVYQKGFIRPKDFIEKFQHLGIPTIVYEGNYNMSLIEDVRNNVYGLNEGLVVKGTTKTKRKDVENVWMSKIKTLQWLQKVKGIQVFVS